MKPLFTKEQYKEIEDARERLAIYKDKIQPYSALPEEPVEEPRVIEHIHRSSNMSRKEFAQLQSLIGEVKYLRGKLKERSDKKKAYKRK